MTSITVGGHLVNFRPGPNARLVCTGEDGCEEPASTVIEVDGHWSGDAACPDEAHRRQAVLQAVVHASRSARSDSSS